MYVDENALMTLGEELPASILQTKALMKAEEVLGNHQAAQDWLVTPALGLDKRAPVALLDTQAGTEMVSDFLTRMAHGVYS
ncbi:antitoxin Xre/MbcA/ParS toxin-binding domain-containing protein [Pseudomonas sp. P9_31]|uniref:antitoxin Xre/MbcA/ParS toxin-binding domain-containing protein n=1 Tax=Pseudomonas sp. P9_31 TaxID=3043448 RepID=UPI002A3586E4|nr:antitoxin Xre/MbcA/ParS toxin-binding domain-containing protein [Pseudomonas sp. P9_31]WPN56003.1 DUF2384 domain-containing protein [Pseudomonas sp. P9_31]